jgi:hypothetical protein
MIRIWRRFNSRAFVANLDRVVWRQPSDGLSYLASCPVIMTSSWRHQLSVFNFNLKLVEVTSSWRHHNSWRWRYKQKIFVRPENEFTRNFNEICLFGRLDTARFSWDMGLWVFGFRLTIQNTGNWHVSNAFDLLSVFISFPLYSITLGLGTLKKRPAPVFWVFRIVYSIAPINIFQHYHAWFCLKEGTFKAAAPKNEVQLQNLTERGNEQITRPPGGRWENCIIVENKHLDVKTVLDCA